jgi:hypothetical protein
MPVAKVNTPSNYKFGRPAKYDVKDLAKKLNEWIEDTDSWDLCKWCALYKVDPLYPHKWAKEDEDFGIAWRTAKMTIASRRNEMMHCGEFNKVIYERYQHNYDILSTYEDIDKKEDEKDRQQKRDIEKMKEEYNLKSQVNIQFTEQELEVFDKFHNVFKARQERKIAESKSNADAKS